MSFLLGKKNHFATLLNDPSTVEQQAVDNIEWRPTQNGMCKCPDLDKMSNVISMLHDGKSPGADELYPEVIKRRGRWLVNVLCTIKKRRLENLGSPWRLEGCPSSHHLKEGRQTRLWQLPRGLASLHTRERVRLHTAQQIIDPVEDFLSETQCGFRGTTERIFSSRQIQEKCIEHNMQWYLKISQKPSTLNREALWNILLKLGCRDYFVRHIASAFHTGMKASVNLRKLTLPFYVENGVKQDQTFSRFFSLWSCLIPQLIPPKKYGYRVNQGKPVQWQSVQVCKKDQKCSCTQTHVWWRHYFSDIQPPRCTGNNHSLLKICKGIWAKNEPQEYRIYLSISWIPWHLPRHTNRGPSTNPNKQILISKLHSRQLMMRN